MLGTSPRHTLKARTLRANSLFWQGRETEAEQICTTVLKTCRTELGPRDELTIDLTHNVAWLLEGRGHHYSAMRLLAELLEARRDLQGEMDVETLDAMESLFNIYSQVGKLEESRILAAQGCRISENPFGTDDENTWTKKQLLVFGNRGVQRRAEALKLQEEVVAWNRKHAGPTAWRTLGSINQLEYDYFYHERYDEQYETF